MGIVDSVAIENERKLFNWTPHFAECTTVCFWFCGNFLHRGMHINWATWGMA